MAPRKSTWEADLNVYLESMAGVEYAYGESDCVTFSAGAVQAITGEDPAAAFRGKYSTAAGSVRTIKRYGSGGSLEASIDALFPEKPWPFAQRGDLIWNGEAVGVCIGDDALFVGQAMNDDGEMVSVGLIRVPRAEWRKAWAV